MVEPVGEYDDRIDDTQDSSRSLSERDYCYLGGVIDGDGSIYVSVEKSIGELGYRIRPRFRLEMKEKQERFIELMQVRELVQELNANREAKYDKEYFIQEFNNE